MTLLAASVAPAATIVTTAETLAANIPQTQLQAPANAQAVTVRGSVTITTGTTVTSVVVRLRAGQNNVATALIDAAEPVDAAASASFSVPFDFVDVNLANLGIGGYSITVVQTGAGTNGTITQVEYEVDLVIP